MHVVMATKTGPGRMCLAACFIATMLALWTPRTTSASGCCDTPGDADNNGSLNIADANRMIQYLFLSGPPPACEAEWDVDGSGTINVLDILRLAFYILGGNYTIGCGPEDGGISFAEREEVFNSVDSILDALDGLSPDSQSTIVYNYLNTNPLLTNVGREGSDVWAQFTDGRAIIIPNNRFPAGNNTERSGEIQLPVHSNHQGRITPQRHHRQLENHPTDQATNGAPAVTTYEVPESLEAHVINTLGAPCFTSASQKVANLLSSSGYVIASTDGSVDGFMQNIQDAGVLYIDAHGGFGKDIYGNPTLGAIWTSTLYSALDDVVYADLLDSVELAYMCAYDLDSGGTCRNHWRYAITDKFIKNYMTFSENSFVLMNTCLLAGGPNNHGFFVGYACKQAGASVYAGWSETVTAHASDKIGEYIFDRMLGTNASTLSAVESPKQRPFGITMLKQDMHNRGLDIDSTNGSELTITYLQDGFEMLAPSIRYVEVINLTDTFFLTGFFGTDPGPGKRHLYIDGHEQTIYQWEPLYIWADIPRNGPGSVGPVVVERDGDASVQPLIYRKSNTVNFTEWKPKFDYTTHDAGTLEGVIWVNAHIRADVHSFREGPHMTPQVNPFLVFSGVKDSDGSSWADGEFVYPVPDSDPHEDLTWEWTGTDPLYWIDSTNLANGVLLQGSINGSNKTMKLFLNGFATEGLTETVTSSLYGLQSTNDLFFSIIFELFDEIPYKLNMDFNAGWSILPGSRSANTCCTVNPDDDGSADNVTHELNWDLTAPNFPPDDNAPH